MNFAEQRTTHLHSIEYHTRPNINTQQVYINPKELRCYLLQITLICTLNSQLNSFLQGSVLQIQGPRGFKGSKGEAVRSYTNCCHSIAPTIAVQVK